MWYGKAPKNLGVLNYPVVLLHACMIVQCEELTNYNVSNQESLSEDNSNAEKVWDQEAEILEKTNENSV